MTTYLRLAFVLLKRVSRCAHDSTTYSCGDLNNNNNYYDYYYYCYYYFFILMLDVKVLDTHMKLKYSDSVRWPQYPFYSSPCSSRIVAPLQLYRIGRVLVLLVIGETSFFTGHQFKGFPYVRECINFPTIFNETLVPVEKQYSPHCRQIV